ncbi:MAG: VOC family protein [Mycobacteriales bacterium]|nr:MAG: VOC family protein [Pseudonocardiales bacterium]
MQERDEYPAGVPCWIDIGQPDPKAAVAFYGGLFGWEFENRMPPRSSEPYFVASLAGRTVAAIGPALAGIPGPSAWLTYVAVDDADATAQRVNHAGGRALREPFDVGPPGRMGIFADPSGAVFAVWQAGETKGAQLVNEPGAWNFSGVITPDREGAEAFYGAVFGWELSAFDPEDPIAGGYWRLPGYGDFLEQINPGTRAGMAEMGAPDRFEDTVATLTPTVSGNDAAPHWDITFGVDDADATAGRAQELGGRVIVPPMDGPWVRMTVLADPQGAVFAASKFVPPT